MKRYSIEKYKEYSSVKLYTIKFDHEELNETDSFITRFNKDDIHKSDFNIIISWINKIGETGALERYFRHEKRALAIPIDSGKSLRLYCHRINDNIVILGNGGIKTSNAVQDSPDCFAHFTLMNHVANKVFWGRKNNKIEIINRELSGKLRYDYQT